MSTNPAPLRPARQPRRRAFSLVEVTIAIGIVAVAFIALLGMLPRGMEMFREAMGTTIGAQIAQRVLNEAAQTDFDVLVDGISRDDPKADGFTFRAPKRAEPMLRYFDDQGNEIVPHGTQLSADEKRQAIYHVNTRILVRTARPGDQAANGIGAPASDVAVVTVQVATNPGHRPLEISKADPSDTNEPDRNLFKPVSGLRIATWSGMVARNQPSPPKS